jgi:hypothetical protein
MRLKIKFAAAAAFAAFGPVVTELAAEDNLNTPVCMQTRHEMATLMQEIVTKRSDSAQKMSGLDLLVDELRYKDMDQSVKQGCGMDTAAIVRRTVATMGK